MRKENEKTLKKKSLLYAADQTPPKAPLILSSLQHALLVLSLGMALPVAVERAAGLDLTHSASYLAAALFCMGVTAVLQTIPGKVIGSGYQSLSTTDSAAICACVLAAETGGIPLVLGMTLFSGILRAVIGSFAYRLRKMFPPEVTGTMVFILGVNLVPTGFKYFLGPPIHIAVAAITLLFMLTCALFIRPLRPYTALAGIVFGYLLAAVTGVFDVSSLAALKEQSAVALPIYKELSFSFDFGVMIPFVIITVAAVVDNIGDFSAAQRANGKDATDWRSIEAGIRGSGLGTALSALIGGSAQSTATTNIGVASAAGITSRTVAYVAGGMLIAVSFFPGVSGVLSMIPEPVLGAVILYSMCYIMSGGFETLSGRELDDRRIFTIFLSVGASISTLIPGLYDFLPESVSRIIVSPMVMGVCVLIIITLIGKIGARKKYTFVTGSAAEDVKALDQELKRVCGEWGTDRMLCRKLQISLGALCEGLYEMDADTRLRLTLSYDGLQIRMQLQTEGGRIEKPSPEAEDLSALAIALSMLPNMFDHVRSDIRDGILTASMDADL